MNFLFCNKITVFIPPIWWLFSHNSNPYWQNVVIVFQQLSIISCLFDHQDFHGEIFLAFVWMKCLFVIFSPKIKQWLSQFLSQKYLHYKSIVCLGFNMLFCFFHHHGKKCISPGGNFVICLCMQDCALQPCQFINRGPFYFHGLT